MSPFIQINKTQSLLCLLVKTTAMQSLSAMLMRDAGQTRQPLKNILAFVPEKTKLNELDIMLIKSITRPETPPPTKSSALYYRGPYLVAAKKWGRFINILIRGVWGEFRANAVRVAK